MAYAAEEPQIGEQGAPNADGKNTGLARSFADWGQRPEAYMAARAKLAALIAVE